MKKKEGGMGFENNGSRIKFEGRGFRGLGNSGYSFGNWGYTVNNSNSRGYALIGPTYSSISMIGYGNPLFINVQTDACNPYAGKRQSYYLGVIDSAKEMLEKYKKKLYDISRKVNSNYRFN